MRTLASHLAVFVIGVILATAAGAMAHPPKQAGLATRLKRLEFRHNVLQSRYQTFCNTLRPGADTSATRRATSQFCAGICYHRVVRAHRARKLDPWSPREANEQANEQAYQGEEKVLRSYYGATKAEKEAAQTS